MTNELSGVGVEALVERAYELRQNERLSMVDLLVHLAELERRNAIVGIGYAGLWDFLTKYLGYSKGAAGRRKAGVEVVRRFPLVVQYLRDGRLSLSTLLVVR